MNRFKNLKGRQPLDEGSLSEGGRPMCEICGTGEHYAKGMCKRCYQRLLMRRRRRKRWRDRVYAPILRGDGLDLSYENLGLVCPLCGNSREFLIDFDRCEIACKVCGVVLVSGFHFNLFYPSRFGGREPEEAHGTLTKH